MQEQIDKAPLPPIPAKRYFTIGEVSELCGVKPHVLRYWEQEFTQLKPVKRRGNRRYYQHHEVLLIRRIRELLYQQGFTINGARNRLEEGDLGEESHTEIAIDPQVASAVVPVVQAAPAQPAYDWVGLRSELAEVLDLLRAPLHQ
ncbi:MerR family transcriptional regulator [Novimethylophilus kurashikiensis]|uniref:MerR family transcriptional regulator n=1 Tax=Novimethylophilus kurashikiensis TaxID=1825523 RepID=A0A2R5FBG9_9PROT|nr:MerR family transcriptional regulator [Novimethylophilus kurashikiensis]GBG14031.1 MerR family transcriptional regulator [Novimethylophilus kurashikiensis]